MRLRLLVGVVAVILSSSCKTPLPTNPTPPPDPPPVPQSSRTVIEGGGASSPWIIWDDQTTRYRLWYHAPTLDGAPDVRRVMYRESFDARTWTAPMQIDSLLEIGTGILPDSGRYRWLSYLPGDGLMSRDSQDGFAWGPWRGPLLRNDDAGIGDIVDPFRDPIRQRWASFVKMYANEGEFGAPPRTGSTRRLTGITTSDDFTHWSNPARVFVPSSDDEGAIEFYGAACCVVRGPRLYAFLRILRDDLGTDGTGYTVLAWTEDGMTWQRETRPFLARCDNSYDAAMAWITSVVERDGTIYFGEAGYAIGHKAYTDRSIAIVTMPTANFVGPGSQGPPCETPR